MKDYRNLKVGDRIKIVSIPKIDIDSRNDQIRRGMKIDPPLDTVRVLQHLKDKKKKCIINEIDDHGHPWIYIQFKNKIDHGIMEHHYIAIWDNDSWEQI